MENLDVSHILATFGQYEEPLRDYVGDHVSHFSDVMLLGVLVFLAASFQIQRKTFFGMLLVDVVYPVLQPNGRYVLKVRTLVKEMPLTEVFPNTSLRWAFWFASHRTSEVNPLIYIRNPNKRQLILNRLVNMVSAEYGEHFLREARGLPVSSQWMWLAMHHEKGEDLPVRKTRVTLVAQELITHWSDYADALPEKNHQMTRRSTLQAIRREARHMPWKKSLGLDAEHEHLAAVEIVLD